MPQPLKVSTFDGILTINSVNMRTKAWSALRYHELWLGAQHRGSDAPTLGVDGLTPYKPLIDETRFDLDFIVSGYHTSTGTRNTDPWDGLKDNLDYLRTNVLDIPANATGTYDGSLTPPGGGTPLTAKLRCLPLVIKEDPDLPVKLYTLTLELPFGQFA